MSLKSFNTEHTDTSHYTVILMTLLSFKVMLGLGNFAFCPIIQVKISGASSVSPVLIGTGGAFICTLKL